MEATDLVGRAGLVDRHCLGPRDTSTDERAGVGDPITSSDLLGVRVLVPVASSSWVAEPLSA